jgi:hypothetical protein
MSTHYNTSRNVQLDVQHELPSHERNQKTVRFQVPRFGFKNKFWTFYTYLSQKEVDDIHKYLTRFYGEEFNDEILQEFIIKNTCKYCLDFGHSCSLEEYPPSCPNLPNDFPEMVRYYSKKFNLPPTEVSILALCRVGPSRPLPGNFKYIVWNWDSLETYLLNAKQKSKIPAAKL